MLRNAHHSGMSDSHRLNVCVYCSHLNYSVHGYACRMVDNHVSLRQETEIPDSKKLQYSKK